MKLTQGLAGILVVLALAGSARADLTWSGSLRNDVLIWNQDNNSQVLDLLENQLVLQRSSQEWKFYGDVRLDIYGGNWSAVVPQGNSLPAEIYQVRILRGFIRYYSSLGDFTVGKTYVNLGISNIFNPFELDRNYQVTDLSYTREGVLAVTDEIALSDLSGLVAYVLPAPGNGQAAGGVQGHFHLNPFDAGVVFQRLDRNENVAGLYAKGDLEIGVQGACAFHMDDHARQSYVQANVGADYSIGEGKWIITLLGYFNGQGSDAGESQALDVARGTAFSSKYYGYADILHAPDEFFQARMGALVNLSDQSALLIPSATWVLADGLNLNVQVLVPTGSGTAQFSSKLLGRMMGMIRIEAKL